MNYNRIKTSNCLKTGRNFVCCALSESESWTKNQSARIPRFKRLIIRAGLNGIFIFDKKVRFPLKVYAHFAIYIAIKEAHVKAKGFSRKMMRELKRSLFFPFSPNYLELFSVFSFCRRLSTKKILSTRKKMFHRADAGKDFILCTRKGEKIRQNLIKKYGKFNNNSSCCFSLKKSFIIDSSLKSRWKYW